MAPITAPYDRRDPEQPKLLHRPSPTNTATPVLRAGFTDVLVTGMLIRWISVSPRPIASGANPCGARLSVAPRMMIRNIIVMTISHTSAARRGIAAGGVRAVAVGSEPCGDVEAGLAAGDQEETRAATTAPRTCETMYGTSLAAGNRPPAQSPMETAGLRWHPEMCPIA